MTRSARRVRRAAAPLTAGLAAALAAVPAAASAHAASANAGPAAAKGGNAVIGWGANDFGELGNGTTADSSVPVFAQVPGGLQFTTVRTVMTSVALTTSGRVYAWGSNNAGQVGDGTTVDRLTPVLAKTPAGVRIVAVRESGRFTLALTSTGKALAWGDNESGELGDGTTHRRLTPVRVRIPRGVTITAISAGFSSALALTKSGRVLSWGFNADGQLGDGTRTTRHLPVYVRLPAHTKITSIAAGESDGYAVTSAGRLLAWGLNNVGQIGDGTTKTRLKPVQVRLPKGVRVVAATVGLVHVLALTTRARALAWGANSSGQLGDGSHTSRRMPVFVKLPAGTKVRALAAGSTHSMALTAGGRVLAWGRNNHGQLGNGSTADSATAVRVHLPFGFTPTAIGGGWSARSGLAIGIQVN